MTAAAKATPRTDHTLAASAGPALARLRRHRARRRAGLRHVMVTLPEADLFSALFDAGFEFEPDDQDQINAATEKLFKALLKMETRFPQTAADGA